MIDSRTFYKLVTKQTTLARFLIIATIISLAALLPPLRPDNPAAALTSPLATGLQMAGIIISCSTFLLGWRSWFITAAPADLIVALTFLTVGVAEFFHLAMVTTPVYSFYWLIADLVLSGGLLAVITHKKPLRGTGRTKKLVYFIPAVIIFLTGLVAALAPEPTIIFSFMDLPAAKILISLMAVILIINILILFRSVKAYPGHHLIGPLRLTLLFALAGQASQLGALATGQTAVPLLTVIYRLAAGGLLFIPVFWEMAVRQPAAGLTRLLGLTRKTATKTATLFTTTEQNYQHLTAAFKSFHAALTAGGKLSEIFDRLAGIIAATFATQQVSLSLVEGDPATFWVIAYRGDFEPHPAPLPQKFMINEYTAGRPVNIPSLTEYHHRLRPEILRAGICSMAGAPIMYENKLLGVIEVFSRRPAAFSPADLDLLRFFAGQAALVIKNSQAVGQASRLTEELTLLDDIVRIITDQLSPTMLLSRVTEKLAAFLRPDAIASFIVHHQTETPTLHEVMVRNFSDPSIHQLLDAFMNNRPPWLWEPAAAGQPEKALFNLTTANKRSFQIMPLFSHQTLQGVIVFLWEYDRQNITSTLQEKTLLNIAQQVGLQLERDYLYSRIRKMSLTDSLTRLSNRRFFDFMLAREIKRANRHHHPLSLLMIDIDFFKTVNDTYGHTVGDQVLRDIGRLLKDSFRETDITARYGGEEMAVILPETTYQHSLTLAEKFRSRLERNPVTIKDNHIKLTVSVGTAFFDPQQTLAVPSALDLILAADRSLYRAKELGRNRVMGVEES